MSRVVIASYNMSFLSDMMVPIDDAQFASEAAFLTNNRSNDRRLYWKNALDLLINFVESYKDYPLVVGLQEMNLTNNELSGTGAVVTRLPEDKYIFIAKEVINGAAKPALVIFYDKEFFGRMTYSEIFDNAAEKGRPMLVVYTEKGYLLINCHGSQKGPEINKAFIEDTAKEFIAEHNLQGKIQDVFIMGDFNDKFDGITTINVDSMTLSYKGDSPYSCCYNWTSSCTNKYYNKKIPGGIECSNETTPKTIMTSKGQIKLPMPFPEGSVENYKFKGDKVFGKTPVEPIFMFHGKNGMNQSVESDHELVYAFFETGAGSSLFGGRRKSRKKSKKSRRTRKTRRSKKPLRQSRKTRRTRKSRRSKK